MAQKSSQARLTIPKDIWDLCKFSDYEKNNFGFFVTNDTRVVILDMATGINSKYEFLGNCHFDDKHRFFIPKNVDCYLGTGNIYYFSTIIYQAGVYVYKTDSYILQKRQNLQLEKLFANL